MKCPLTRLGRISLFGVIAIAGGSVFLMLPPLRQPQSYHHFADTRTMLRIPNFLNVASNFGFLVVGALGLHFLWKKRSASGGGQFIDSRERLPYAFFFAGVLLTCFGSGYYHWKPDDATLVWDRLPMTVAFMSLLAAIIGERIDVTCGLWMLWPLVLAGILSVWWWSRTGNLWPYAGAQYFSVALILLLLALFPARYTRAADLIWVTGFYVLAKIFEALDSRIFALTHFVSGHTIKHLAAALGVYWVLWMLINRSHSHHSLDRRKSLADRQTRV